MFILPRVTCHHESNFKFLYLDRTDSDGIKFKNIVSNVVQATGLKQHYNHAHEWCSGHGAMGFTLLTDNVCDRLTLSDIDVNSILSCRFTAAANLIQEKVDTFLIEKFTDIPIPGTPWDLIITNPPYVPDQKYYQTSNLDDRTYTMWVDSNWQAHKDFFSNLKNYIDNDCDIYMFGMDDYVDQQISIAKENEFKFVQKYHDLKLPNHEKLSLLHFRAR